MAKPNRQAGPRRAERAREAEDSPVRLDETRTDILRRIDPKALEKRSGKRP
jgi:hypothetical protein